MDAFYGREPPKLDERTILQVHVSERQAAQHLRSFVRKKLRTQDLHHQNESCCEDLLKIANELDSEHEEPISPDTQHPRDVGLLQPPPCDSSEVSTSEPNATPARIRQQGEDHQDTHLNLADDKKSAKKKDKEAKKKAKKEKKKRKRESVDES